MAIQQESVCACHGACESASCYEEGMAYEVVHCQGMSSNSFTLSSTGEALAGEEYCPVLSSVVKERYKIIRDCLKDSIRRNQKLEMMILGNDLVSLVKRR